MWIEGLASKVAEVQPTYDRCHRRGLRMAGLDAPEDEFRAATDLAWRAAVKQGIADWLPWIRLNSRYWGRFAARSGYGELAAWRMVWMCWEAAQGDVARMRKVIPHAPWVIWHYAYFKRQRSCRLARPYIERRRRELEAQYD